MIKLSKKVTTIFFVLCLLIGVYYFILIISSWNDVGIFQEIYSFFTAFLISTLFLGIYNYNYKKSTSFMASPFLTMALLLCGTMFFSLFIIKLHYFGFQNVILFEQISIIILAVLGLGLLIGIHVKLIKTKGQFSISFVPPYVKKIKEEFDEKI